MKYDKQKEYNNDAGHEPLVEIVLSYINNGVALDLGAGLGSDAMFLAESGFKVITVDNDEIHQSTIRKKALDQKLDIELVNADILLFKPVITFDVVICNMVLHFFTPQQIKSIISNMKSWTKIGGLNVIVAYSDKNSYGKRPYLFKQDELKDFYDDWNIISYEEKPTPWFHLTKEPQPRRNHAVYLIAQKSR